MNKAPNFIWITDHPQHAWCLGYVVAEEEKFYIVVDGGHQTFKIEKSKAVRASPANLEWAGGRVSQSQQNWAHYKIISQKRSEDEEKKFVQPESLVDIRAVAEEERGIRDHVRKRKFDASVPAFALERPGSGYFVVQIDPQVNERLKSLSLIKMVLFSDDGNSQLVAILDTNGIKCFLNDQMLPEHQEPSDNPQDDLRLCFKRELAGISHAFWISINSGTNKIKLGIGEAHQLTEKKVYSLVNVGSLNNIRNICIFCDESENDEITQEKGVTIYSSGLRPLRGPIVVDDGQKTEIDHLTQSESVSVSTLEEEIRQIYGEIKNLSLNVTAEDIPGGKWTCLGQAVDFSVRTPDCFLYQMLHAKFKKSNKKHFRETYLRIEVTEQDGTAPGSRNVFEIWPPGHYSPIHKHGNSYGVIKIVYGELKVKHYPWLSDCDIGKTPYNVMTAGAGTLTWFSPSQYQIHSVHNMTPVTTISLQCYAFPKSRLNSAGAPSEAFDILTEEGKIKPVLPTTDWEGKWKEFWRALYSEFTGQGQKVTEEKG